MRIVTTAAATLALLGGLAVPARACLAPRAATCGAVRTWAHHRTPANLSRLVTASRHASPTIRTDVEVVVTEVRQNDWYDLPADLNFLYVDACR